MALIRICNEDRCQRKHKARGYCASHYNATPERRATIARCHAAAKERATRPSKTTTAPTHVTVPDLPQPDPEAQGRAILRYVVGMSQNTTTWDARQYLVDLLCEAEGVRVLSVVTEVRMSADETHDGIRITSDDPDDDLYEMDRWTWHEPTQGGS